MTCLKCNGLMFYDSFIEDGVIAGRCWHCCNCGEMIDLLILTHRRIFSRIKGRKPRYQNKPLLIN